MTKKTDVDDLRLLDGVAVVLTSMESHARHFEVPKKMLAEIKSSLKTRDLVPDFVKADDEESVRESQEALARLQGRLDRIILIHFAVRDRLELINRLEIRSKHALIAVGAIPDSASGPRVALAMIKVIPELVEIRDQWIDIEKRCEMSQNHLKRAVKIIEHQLKLDDNVRWAQYRT